MGIAQHIASLFRGYNWMIIPAAFLTIVLHEISHGYVAFLLGDRTAKNAGRLTLNPLKHIDIIGLLSMIIFGFGWAKPVPVNAYFFKNRKRDMAIVALAGPLSNLILALLGLLICRLLDAVVTFFVIFAQLNVGLAVFNLIPIPPLDGSKVLNSLLPERIYFKIMQYEQFGFLILLVLLNVPVFEWLIGTVRQWIFNGLFAIVGL